MLQRQVEQTIGTDRMPHSSSFLNKSFADFRTSLSNLLFRLQRMVPQDNASSLSNQRYATRFGGEVTKEEFETLLKDIKFLTS